MGRCRRHRPRSTVSPAVAGVDAASITLKEKNRWQTAASTHDQLVQADQLQYDLDQGPCVDATADADHYVVPDVAHDRRWDRWAPQAARLGLGSLLASLDAAGAAILSQICGV